MAKGSTAAIETRHGCLWAVLPDTIDMDNYGSIEQRVEAELSERPRDVVLDFSHTKFLFSSGIGMVVRLKKSAEQVGRKCALVNVGKRIVEGLENVGLDTAFEIFSSEDEFVKARGA